MRAIKIYRIGHWFYTKKLRRMARLMDLLNYFLHNSRIPSSAQIGYESIFAYGSIGVVIHNRAVIGKHCMIGQGITIGGKSGSSGVPVVEDNVFIGPGARILGDITIGHDSIIGANSVVTKDVPPYSVVAGVPAKIISKIDKKSYNSKYRHYYGPIDYLKSDSDD